MTCPHRRGSTCRKIQGPDAYVTDADCAACPFTAIGCAHLRFGLVKTGEGVVFHRPACAEKVRALIDGPADCTGCRERAAIRLEDVQPVQREGRGKVLVFPYRWARMSQPGE
jgi:hypothetical protein